MATSADLVAIQWHLTFVTEGKLVLENLQINNITLTNNYNTLY